MCEIWFFWNLELTLQIKEKIGNLYMYIGKFIIIKMLKFSTFGMVIKYGAGVHFWLVAFKLVAF